MERKSNIWLFGFFLALLLVKVSSFHVYSHTDDDCHETEACLYCELAIENQNTGFTLPESPNLEIDHLNFYYETPKYSFLGLCNSAGFLALKHSRPPPFVA